MSSDVSNFVIQEYPSSKVLKKSLNPQQFNSKLQKLPEKDQRFIEEFKKREKPSKKIESHGSVSKKAQDTSINQRGFSVKNNRNHRSKYMTKQITPSDLKSLTLNESQSGNTLPSSIISLEKKNLIDLSYKYFIGPGNNDSLVKRIMAEKAGWIKAFTPHSANLIWTEVKQYGIFELIPIGLERKHRGQEENKPKQLSIENFTEPDRLKLKLYNKVEGNKELASKKKLFHNMISYYKMVSDNPFKYLPLTFHIVDGTKDPSFGEFVKKFNDVQKDLPKDPNLNNCWIVKPGESTNRGIGITVCSTVDEVAKVVDDKRSPGKMQRTYIVQKYLYRPMLYLNRKFDIRCYTLITFLDNKVTAYFYRDGYMRTSCQEFDMENIKNRFIHLTNDAVQKYSPDYGRFEDGNKLSYDEFQNYIDQNLGEKVNFKEFVYPKIKKIVQDTVKATHKKLDLKRRKYSFEIFGYDFMLDEMFSPWLLEVNTNPCLALSGQYLAKLIPQMLRHAFEIILPPLFPSGSEISSANQFEQIFSYKRS